MNLKRMARICLVALTLGLFTTGLASGAAGTGTSCGTGCTSYLTGNATDVTPTTSGGLVLMGGGTDVDEAFRWMISKSGGGNFVVIRASGADGYNPYIYSDLGGVASVETLVISTRKAAAYPAVAAKIRAAEALFIAGGNQADYVNDWKGTPVEDAIHYLVQKGVPIGGTSAGLAIMGESYYGALTATSVVSADALANPYNRNMTLGRDFLVLPNMAGRITDSHFVTRDRMGRLVAFMARISKDGWTALPKGIGIDEQTAVLVDPSGAGRIVGQSAAGTAYFLAATQAPSTCLSGTPLTYQNIAVYKAPVGATFNLATWSGAGGSSYSLNVNNGVLTSTQTGGSIY